MGILFKSFLANDAIMMFPLETRHEMEILFLEDSGWLQTSPSGALWRKQQLFRYY